MQNWPNNNYDIILGDVNAHNELWNINDASDSRGKAIVDWMMGKNMVCCNNGEATHFNRGTGTTSTPDITIAHPSLLDSIEWKVVNDLNSDHFPIIISIEGESDNLTHNEHYNWNLKKADWTNFESYLNSNITSHEERCIDKQWKTFKKNIIEAANKFVKTKKCHSRNKPWMTPSLKSLIKERNNLRKNFRNNPDNRDLWINKC